MSDQQHLRRSSRRPQRVVVMDGKPYAISESQHRMFTKHGICSQCLHSLHQDPCRVNGRGGPPCGCEAVADKPAADGALTSAGS